MRGDPPAQIRREADVESLIQIRVQQVNVEHSGAIVPFQPREAKPFTRVRHFGWLSPAAKKRWQRLHALLDWKPAAPPEAAAAPCWAPLCPNCQQPMRLLGTFARSPP